MSVNWKLNTHSKLIQQPEKFVGSLFRHQQAMLYRALSIEKQSKQFGFMADVAGTGKTSIIISLCLIDKQIKSNKKTIIIVPQNIIKQWINEIKKFSGNSLNVKELTYNDIIDIESHCTLLEKRYQQYKREGTNIKDETSEFPEELKEYDIFITTNDLFETLMSSLNSNGITIHRIVYDEIDTMENSINLLYEKKQFLLEEKNSRVKSIDFIPPVYEKGLKNKITWFVSASIFNLIDPKLGFTFLGKTISNDELPNIFIKCDNQFIRDSLPEIPEEQEEIYECNCIADKYEQLLSVDQLDAINSLSYDTVKIKNRKKVPNSEVELLKMLITEYFDDKEEIIENINEIKNKMKKFQVENENNHPLANQIKEKEKDYKFVDNISNAFHKVNCSEIECPDTKLCIFNKFDEIDNRIKNNKKISIINDILIECKKENGQVLIFSDFQGSFKHLPSLIERIGMTYSDLCKGTSELVNEEIEKYKNKQTDILFIESSSDGCGLNLQNTTHLIFLHRTDQRLKDQLIGRAQRQGRIGSLKIISLYNSNEILEEDTSDEE